MMITDSLFSICQKLTGFNILLATSEEKLDKEQPSSRSKGNAVHWIGGATFACEQAAVTEGDRPVP